MEISKLVKLYGQKDTLHVPEEPFVVVQEPVQSQRKLKKLKKTVDYTPTNSQKVGKYVALDCEMVGVGPEGVMSALARCSIVNYHEFVLMDEYCKPQERVTDYRTYVSGIEPHHLKNAKSFLEVQTMAHAILKDKIVVGHALRSDFDALMMSHPYSMCRDTAKYTPFRNKYSAGRTPGLKLLCKEVLGKSIQQGGAHALSEGHSGHSSVEDARAVMELFKTVKLEWESKIKNRQRKSPYK